jgi:hypothetical protein
MPPPGLPVYWWKLPREYWPYKDEMPWEPKIPGAWPPSQITTVDDVSSVPSFGYIKLKVPGEPDTSGNQIAFVNMKMHMRHLSPDEMKVKTAITPLGPRYYLESAGWSQYEFEYKTFQDALKMRRKERFMEMLASEIVKTRGKPKLSRDLFT